eukprot:6490271-Amphidinium_carterae.2
MKPQVWCWLRQALRWSYAVAGHSLYTLADQAGMDVNQFIDCTAEEHATDPFAMTFIEAVACLLRMNVAMLNSDGKRSDGFWRVKSYGIQLTLDGWAVIGPLGLPPQHDVSPTLPFSEHSSGSDGHVWQVLPYSQDTPPLQGGARGQRSKKRRRAVALDGEDVESETPCDDSAHSDCGSDAPSCARSCANAGHPLDVHFPTWSLKHISIGASLRQLHVSVGNETPQTLQVPSSWSIQYTEESLARHLCCMRDWLTFTWANNDVFIEFSHAFPLMASSEAAKMFDLVDGLPSNRKSSRKRSLSHSSEVIVGHRSTRAYGVTAFTQAHEDFCHDVVVAASSFLPEAVFNAMAVVTHGDTPAHRDSMNDGEQHMFLIPRHIADDAWIWVESARGSSSVVVDGSDVFGSWLPLSRVVCFPGAAAHMLQAPSSSCTIVLYRTARMPRCRDLHVLAHLEFSLSVQELAKLADGASSQEEDDAVCPIISGSESEAVPGDPDAAVLDPEAEQSEGQPATALPCVETISQPGIGALSDTITVRVLKQRVNGTYRTIAVELEAGSTAGQLKFILKKHLHLNIAKLKLSVWDDSSISDELDDAVDLRETLGPFLLRIMPIVPAATSVRQRSTSRHDVPPVASRPPLSAASSSGVPI